MALTDLAIRSAKPREAQYKLFDGGGLYLIVGPSGGKWWRLKHRFGGKEQQLSIGVFPAVGLKEARRRRDEAREQLAAGLNPSFEKKRQAVAASIRAANTFKAVAEEKSGRHETAKRLLSFSRRVFRYAIATDLQGH